MKDIFLYAQKNKVHIAPEGTKRTICQPHKSEYEKHQTSNKMLNLCKLDIASCASERLLDVCPKGNVFIHLIHQL